jgi:uncharacterized iron-regulated membrane protein
MKLKGPGNRAYNIFFHTHTVSGIVISVALYIIFFAGAFTLFKSEFYTWENPLFRKHISADEIRTSEVFKALYKEKPTLDINEDIYITLPSEHSPLVNIYGHLTPGKDGKEIHFTTKMHPETYAIHEAGSSTIGETLYRLHFLDQIPYLGRWLAGFVALFFVFATITGLLIHWKNMLPKFWSFSFRGAWKQIWTNSHTVFGLLGLPYQLMYAITGAFYLLLLLVLLPAVMVFYKGNPEKVYAMAYPNMAVTYDKNAKTADNFGKVEEIYKKVEQDFNGKFEIISVNTRNIMKEDGAINFRLRSLDKKTFASYGYLGYRLKNGSEVYSSLPGVNKTYTHSVVEAIGHLHFATFGGILVKTLYFLMALFTCFVIVSGILIWKEARKNKNYTDQQKRFHHRVTVVFLAICFGLFPATAILFHAELWIKGGEQHKLWVDTTFFLSWLLLTIAGIVRYDEKKLTRFYLFAGGVFSVTVPLTNGLTTGDWLWKSLSSGQNYIAGTDLFWLITGITCLLLTRVIAPTKRPGQQLQKTEEVILNKA